MKKLLSLITLLACAGSLYAAEAGTLTPSSVGFEEDQGYVADTVISNTFQEAGNATGFYQWWSAGSDEGETGTIKLYDVAVENPSEGEEEGGEATPASETEAGLPRYDYGTQNVGSFVNLGSGNQYLNVETTTGKPLYRTLATWANNFLWVKTEESGEKTYWTDDGDPSDELQQTEGWYKEYQVTNITNIAGVEIGSEGKVIDTLVQFTASETAPELADGDKLVVWLKQQTEDDKPTDWQDEIKVGTKYTYTWTDGSEVTHTNEYDAALTADEMTAAGIPENTVPTETDVMEANVWPCFTNLMVTAGQLASDGTVDTNTFTISANEDVLPDKWYRLTIRAIENVTTYTSKQSGFAIYLDGVAVACMDDDYAEKLLDGFEVEKLSSTAKGLYDNKQLFISAVSSTSGASVLTAVGFDGTGKIDDLTINTVENGPQFAMGKRLFKVEWDSGLTGFTIVAKNSEGTISTTPFLIEGGAAGAKEFDFADGATTYEICALDFASGSTLSEVTATGAEQSSDNGVYSFTNFDFAPVVKIGVATTLAYVEGIEKGFSNFAQAIAAAIEGGKKLTLAADITLTAPLTVEAEQTLIIDLAGNDLAYNPSVDLEVDYGTYPAMFTVNGSMTLIDSVGGGKLAFATEELTEACSEFTYLIEKGDDAIVHIGATNDKGAIILGQIQATSIYSGWFDGYWCGEIEDEVFAYLDLIATSEGSTGPVRSEGLHPLNDGTTYPLYWIVTNSGAGGEDPDPEPTDPVITINVAADANATVTVDGEAYDSAATYTYTGNDVVIVATANNGYTYTGVQATGWTIAGDGTTATNTVSGIAADVTVNVPAAVQKADEGPKSWADVDGDTEVSDVVNTTTYEALTNANSKVTAVDIKNWALTNGVEFAASGISVSAEALMLNCANNADAIADAKEDFKVDDTMFNEIMENIGNNFEDVDFSSLATKYPCAKFEVIEYTLGEKASENAKFYKLKMTLK